MISKENLSTINKLKQKKFYNLLLQFSIFFVCLFFCYQLNIEYNENTSLVNDKLIDVSSIFFGIFLGSLYLFEKFKNDVVYQEFLFFCKRLLYLNIVIIAYSFIIIIINNKIPINQLITIREKTYFIKLRVSLFSFYISIFALTLYNIWRFVKIILIILKSNK